MRINFQYAIGIIAALSLLLGLSLGQLHHQQREIHTLKQQPPQSNTITFRPAASMNCDIQHYDKVLRCLDRELRTRMDVERFRVEREKERLEEEIKAALRDHRATLKEVKRDKTHVILQEEL